MAYRIKESEVESVLSHLDYREKGGYERVQKLFFPKDQNLDPFEITIYIAHLSNMQYAGEADEDEIARQIVSSVGPSGPNVEYVQKLAAAMRQYVPEVHDKHLFSIEKKVLDLLESS